MKHIVMIAAVLPVLLLCNVAMAQEKPLILKGLYIGMNINDARSVTEKLFGKEWTISPVGDSAKILEDYRFGEQKIFGKRDTFAGANRYLSGQIVGDRGFAIINTDYNSYEGFISSDQSNCVTRISLSKVITNLLFSAEKIDAEDFAPAFWKNYNMPDFPWIPYGWAYTSPNGYTITIKTDKFIDIKKEDTAKAIDDKPKQSIKFN